MKRTGRASLKAVALMVTVTFMSCLLAHYLPAKFLATSQAGVILPDFTISTSADLALFRDNVNKGISSDKIALLSGDIALSGDWTPIGTKANPFKGTFLGGCNTISGMTITSNDTVYGGLFGYTDGAKVQELTVAGAITLDMASAKSEIYVGMLAGYAANSDFQGCYASGTAGITPANENKTLLPHLGGLVGYSKNSVFKDCSSSATVDSNTMNSTAYIGGIVGYSTAGGEITNCAATGGVEIESTTGETYSGGIVGYNNGASVTNCLANAIAIGGESATGTAVAGGIAGYNTGNIKNCAATGSIAIEESSTASYIGGIVGDNISSIVNCASSLTISGKTVSGMKSGGIAGRSSGSISNSGWLKTSASFDVGEGNHGTMVAAYTASDDIVTACLPFGKLSADLVPVALTVQINSEDQYVMRVFPGGASGDVTSFSKYIDYTPRNYSAVVSVDKNAASPDHVEVTAGTALGSGLVMNDTALRTTNFTGDLKGVIEAVNLQTAKPVRVVTQIVAVTGLSMDKNIATVSVGSSAYLIATVNPPGAMQKGVTWMSGNPAVAKVSPLSGISGGSVAVTGVAEGKTVITAKTNIGGFTASCEVTVRGRGPIVTDDSFVAVSPDLGPNKPADVEATCVKLATTADKENVLGATRFLPVDLSFNIKGHLIVTDAIATNAVNSALAGKNLTAAAITNLPIAAASLDVVGNTATYAYNVSGDQLLADSLENLKLVKIFPGGTGELFGIATKSVDFKDKFVTLLDVGTSTVHTGAIVPTDTYTLVAFIKDGQKYDLDETANGIVIDPMALVQAKQGGGSGGCGVGFGAFALLAVMPLFFRKRK